MKKQTRMKRGPANGSRLATFLLLAVLLASCRGPLDGSEEDEAAGYGTLIIKLAGTVDLARSWAPGIELEVRKYDVTGLGPSGAHFEKLGLTNDAATELSLVVGKWKVRAIGYNTAGDSLVEAAEQEVQVGSKQVATLELLCLALDGQGNFNLTLDWPELDLASPSLEASLRPLVGGGPVVLEGGLNVAKLGATYTALPESGSYELYLSLKDGTEEIWGDRTAVLMCAGESTTAANSLDLGELLRGSFSVSITTETITPLSVGISPPSAFVDEGELLELRAAATGASAFQWYLNGTAIEGADSELLQWRAPDLASDRGYNIGVIAKDAAGKRYGSARAWVAVRASSMTLLEGPIGGIGANGGSVAKNLEGGYLLRSGPGAASQAENQLTATIGSPRLGGKAYLGFTDANQVELSEASKASFRLSFTRTEAGPGTNRHQYFNLILDGPGVTNTEGGTGVLVAITPQLTADGPILLDPSPAAGEIGDLPIFDFYGGRIAGFNADEGGNPKAYTRNSRKFSELFGKGLRFVNAVTNDNGTPKGKKLAGLLIIEGDSTKSAGSDTASLLTDLEYSY